MKIKHYLFLLLTLTFALPSQAQRRKKRIRPSEVFEAGALLGMNLTQIDGDYFTGFDKVGWYGGIRGIVNLNYRTSLNMELLYSQKGSKIPHGVRFDAAPEVRDRLVAVDYVDVPILLKYKLKDTPRSSFIEIGPVYSRLVNSRIREKAPETIEGTVYRNIESEFKSSDISIMAGLGVNPYQNLELSFRYAYSVSKFYDNVGYADPNPFSGVTKEVRFLRHYHFTLVASYKFLATID